MEENYEYSQYRYRKRAECFSRGNWNNVERGYSPTGNGILTTNCSTASEAY
jgi:hypothetical protein